MDKTFKKVIEVRFLRLICCKTEKDFRKKVKQLHEYVYLTDQPLFDELGITIKELSNKASLGEMIQQFYDILKRHNALPDKSVITF